MSFFFFAKRDLRFDQKGSACAFFFFKTTKKKNVVCGVNMQKTAIKLCHVPCMQSILLMPHARRRIFFCTSKYPVGGAVRRLCGDYIHFNSSVCCLTFSKGSLGNLIIFGNSMVPRAGYSLSASFGSNAL